MKCKICDSENIEVVFIAKNRMYKNNNRKFTYYGCKDCSCIQLKNLPKQKSKYYPSNYYSYKEQTNYKGFKNYVITKRDAYAIGLGTLFGGFIYFFKPNRALRSLARLRLKSTDIILDIGSGSCRLLLKISNLGFKNCTGIDPYIDTNINSKIRCVRGELKNFNGKADLIMYHHSLEHIENQHQEFKSIKTKLNDTGVCIIRIPVSTGYAVKKYKENWVQLDAPRHIFLHSHDSINLLCKKSGLKIIDTYDDSESFQFWGSEAYREGRYLVDIKTGKALVRETDLFLHKRIFYNLKSYYLNKKRLGDQSVFYLMHE
ncbi:class I SAM-dependent methyltransferase [Methylophilaceae bacterium]|nr:class I SAM-dependent methyltransferase [Methylophilaceae bacterium]